MNLNTRAGSVSLKTIPFEYMITKGMFFMILRPLISSTNSLFSCVNFQTKKKTSLFIL